MFELEGERRAARPFPKFDLNNDPRPQVEWLITELLDLYDPTGPADERRATLKELTGVCHMMFSLNKIRWDRVKPAGRSVAVSGLDLSEEARDEMAKVRKKPNGGIPL